MAILQRLDIIPAIMPEFDGEYVRWADVYKHACKLLAIEELRGCEAKCVNQFDMLCDCLHGKSLALIKEMMECGE